MTTDNFESSAIAWVALTTGFASVAAIAFIILFYTVGDPFGTLNDLFNGIAGILSGVLAWMLLSKVHLTSPIHQITLLLALTGAVVVVIGSILILFDITGWVLAGWYTTVGNALLGLWLIAFSDSMRRTKLLPQNLSMLGRVAGSIMAVGMLAIPGILRGIDSMERKPWYVSLGFLGFLGTYLLYPVWTLWLGRTLFEKTRRLR